MLPYDVIIHGGGLYAGGLCGINTIVKHFDVISDKQIILFSCGLADPEDPENVAHIESGLEKVLTPEMREKIRQFHLRGGIDYSRLGLTHKAMMAMLRRVMLKKGYDNLRSEDQMMLDTYGGTVDFTNRESLAPLLNYVRSLPYRNMAHRLVRHDCIIIVRLKLKRSTAWNKLTGQNGP